MNLSGHTLPFAVLEHPVGHTLSPAMHNANIAALGLDAVYLAFDVAPERLMPALNGMRDLGFRGVNLTVPLKEVAFRGLRDLDASARALRAVNTVEFADGGLRGHNTDGKGFLLAIREAFGVSVRGRSVFVVGAGGAGRAVAITAAVDGAREIHLADLDPARAPRVAREIRRLAPAAAVRVVPNGADAWVAAARDADLVVQATPVGMKRQDPSVLPPQAFRRGQFAFDLVYMYPETPFMKAAVRGGARAANGLGMLLHQGAWAFRIWTGTAASVGVMRKALERSVYGTSRRSRRR